MKVSNPIRLKKFPQVEGSAMKAQAKAMQAKFNISTHIT